LHDTHIYLPILLLPSDFHLFDDDYTGFAQHLRYLYNYNEIVATFLDGVGTRLPIGRHRLLLATFPVPRNFYVGSTSDSNFNLKVRVSFSFQDGRADLIPIRVRMLWKKHGEVNPYSYLLHDFAPLTNTSIQLHQLFNREFIVPSTVLSSFPNGGCMHLEIARRYVVGENDEVYLHGAEVLYPARLE